MYKFNFDFLFRKKNFNEDSVTDTQLSRVMGLLDVTAIGISSTLGSGIYVLAGSVITNQAGPSIVFSFMIAALATFFSGICYAELGSRVPRSGSAYVYIYVTIGEFLGFIIGWDLILEYVIGTASTASALSQYLDALTGRKIRSALRVAMPLNITGLGPYPDFLAFAFAILVTILMIVGVKESATANKIFTVLNILILLFIIVTGAVRANIANWNINVQNLTWIDEKGENQSCNESTRCGSGGYTPFGISGLIMGSAKCFYAYIGFDAIASTGEEVVNPKRNIPLSIIITLVIVTVLYCGVSCVLTLMIPYYLLDSETPLPNAFTYANLEWAKYVVSIGAIASLCTCLYAGMFPMPRIVYSMAADGLIFRFLSKLLPKLKTPFVASIVTGVFAGILATIFNLDELVEMLSIGTLMAYTLVSICVLLLRYRCSKDEKQNINVKKSFVSSIFGESNDSFFKRLFNPSLQEPDMSVTRLVNILAFIAILLIIGLCILLSKSGNISQPYVIALIIVFGIGILFFSSLIYRQPQVKNIKTFKVPFIPFSPLISVFINTYMMTTLSGTTWARFIIWFLIGLVVYFCYGIRKSNENHHTGNQLVFFPCVQKSTIRDQRSSKNGTFKF